MVILISGPCDCAMATTRGCASQLTVTACLPCFNWGSARASRARFGALAEMPGIGLEANEVAKFQSPRLAKAFGVASTRGRVRSPDLCEPDVGCSLIGASLEFLQQS